MTISSNNLIKYLKFTFIQFKFNDIIITYMPIILSGGRICTKI